MPSLAPTALLAAPFLIAASATTAAAQTTCTDPGAFELLGGGTPGARGMPRLVFDGAPLVGRPFALRLERAAGGAFGYLGLGASDSPTPLPAFGAVVHPAPLFLLVPFSTTADGRSDALVMSDDLPEYLCGVRFIAQAFVFDAAAQGGLAFSGGRRVAIGADRPKKRFRDEVAPSSTFADGLMLGDLDGDGRLDAIAHSEYHTGPAVHLGRDGARFAPAPVVEHYSTSDVQYELGDIDGDGILDLVSTAGCSLSTQRGVGDGTFEDPVSYYWSFWSICTPFRLADVNGDGALDVLSTGYELGTMLSVVYNDGAGAFTNFAEFPAGFWPSLLAVGDVDGDGDVDAVTRNQADATLTVLANAGDGTFAVASTYPYADMQTAIELVDLNGDDRLDLLELTSGPDQVLVRLGNGTGAFGPPIPTVLPHLATDVEVADIDGDGAVDLVLALDGGSGPFPVVDYYGRVLVLLGRSDGSFDTGAMHLVLGSGPTIELADIDSDGWTDLIHSTEWTHGVGVLRGTGPGTFESAMIRQAPQRAFTAVSVDVDVDGFDDVLVPSADLAEIWLYRGSPQGLDATASTIAVQALEGFGTGWIGENLEERFRAIDATGDGVCDLLTSGLASIDVHAGDGSGSFSLVHGAALPDRPTAIEAADLDGDGNCDLIAYVPSNGELHVAMGAGPGSWASQTVTTALGPGVRSMVFADFDGDGVLDLAAATISPSLSVAVGLGDGSFGPLTAMSTGSHGRSVACADIDRDGHLDLAVSNESSTADASVLFGFGDGSFVDERRVPIGRGCTVVELADFDRDGHLDLVGLCDGYLGTVRVMRGDGTGEFSPATGLAPANGGTALARGDVDGDGLAEWFTVDPSYYILAIHDDLLFD